MTRCIEDNRVGLFNLHSELFDRNPDGVLLVMRHMIIFRAEFMAYRQEFEYLAFSDLFEKQSKGACAPRYLLVINSVTNIVEAQIVP